MSTVVRWRGVAVALDAAPEVVATFVPHLPPFFDIDLDGGAGPDSAESATLTQQDGWLSITLAEDLSYAGPAGPETLRAMASRLELLIANRLPELATVHAGVVAIDGRAVLIPGLSMAGKSTLVRALLATGATYLSDEFALLTPDGRVRPYPRRMTIRTATGSERIVPDTAADVDAAPFPIGVIALLRYDAAGWDVQPLSSGQAVLGLVQNGVSVRRAPEQAMTAFGAAVQQATVVTGTRGDADDAARLVRDLL